MSDLRPARRAVVGAALALPLTARAAAPKASAIPLPIVELRRYRTHPGRRDELTGLFEREFVESQEAAGMDVIGTFREPADPDRFTWIRGFADMAARERGLNQFYFGPIWQAHREQANACLEDNDDVLLLREARPGGGFAPSATSRPPAGASLPAGVVAAVVCLLAGAGDEAAAITSFERDVRPGREASGARVLASFVREKGVNSFPRLPVREDREVFVWFEGFADRAAFDRAPPAARLGLEQQTLVLAPTARSLLRG